MKRVLAMSVLVAAVASIGMTAANATVMASGTKSRHDVCIGTMDPNGTQHPIICINPPPF